MANPIATIISAAMMLEWLATKRSSNALRGMAADIRLAVDRTMMDQAALTRDVGGEAGTRKCAEAVVAALAGPS